MRRNRAGTLVAVGAATALAASGCGLPGLSQACTDMGGVSHVSVRVAPELVRSARQALPPTAPSSDVRTPPRRLLIAGVCVRDVCRDAALLHWPDREAEELAGSAPFDLEKDPVTARVSLRRADASVVVPATDVQLHPVTHDVNGGGCGPMIQVAEVRFDETGAHETTAVTGR